jgi:hypothetical protein
MVATGKRESRESAPGRRKSRKSTAVQTMAKTRCPKRTSGVERSILVAATRRTLTADETRARIIHAVEAVVSTTSRWGTPADERTVGDHRFLILDFCPSKAAGLYVQLWTEPDEPVLVEVCSGAWTPPARKYVRGPQRAALRSLGYEVGGQARNFQKQWTVRSPRDARRLARELVDILVDVFGYRGRQPLAMNYCAEGRSHEGQVFDGFVVDDVKRVLAVAGLHGQLREPLPPAAPVRAGDASTDPGAATSSSPSASPGNHERRLLDVGDPFPFVIELAFPAKRVPVAYIGLRLLTVLDDSAGLSDADVITINNQISYGRIQRDPVGRLMLVLDLVLEGITVRWFVSMLEVWRQVRKRAVVLVKRAARACLASDRPDRAADDVEVDERSTQPARTVVH